MSEEKHSSSNSMKKKKKAGGLQAIQTHFVPEIIIKQVFLDNISRHMEGRK